MDICTTCEYGKDGVKGMPCHLCFEGDAYKRRPGSSHTIGCRTCVHRGYDHGPVVASPVCSSCRRCGYWEYDEDCFDSFQEELRLAESVYVAEKLDKEIMKETMESMVNEKAETHRCEGKCNDLIKEPELTDGGYPNPLAIHDELCKAGREIMMKKNHDYTGGSGDPYANFRGSTALGIPNIQGILLRVQDKMMRIKTFEEKGKLQVKDEGIQDALIDVINYMVLIGGLVKEMQNEKSEKTQEHMGDVAFQFVPYTVQKEPSGVL